jgi:hypothetical protein
MTYKLIVTPEHERKQQILLACQSSTDRLMFHEYQNSSQPLTVVRIPIDLPVYRMANGRTRTEQLKYVRQHGVSQNFFSAGQENVEAQQAQHEILRGFSQDGTDSITPIYEVLREVGKQTEPILITAIGVVINGNRRLAAMRELYSNSSGTYQSFSHINCIVLPTITEKEIKEIELKLQMQPETKLPYTWVNEALTIRDLLQSGFTRDEIARDMRRKQPSEIDSILQALAHAEVYLKDWRRQPQDYDLVEGNKQLFADMAKHLRDKTGEELEISRRFAFVLVDKSKQLKNRAYAFNFSFGKRSADVADLLATRAGIDLVSPPSNARFPEDALDVDFGDETEGVTLQPLIDAFDDPEQRNQMSQQFIDVIESIKAADQDERRGQATLRAITDANTKLQEADLSTADTETYSAILAQIESVILRATILKQELNALGVSSALPQ